MRAVLDELGLDEVHGAQLRDYLVMAAHMLVSQQAARGGSGPDVGMTPA
jgi:hypothetical protein